MSAGILLALLRANLAGSLAILLVLALRRLVRRRFGPSPAYALWLAPPAFALASLLPLRPPAGPLSPAVMLATSAAQGLEPLAEADGALGAFAVLWAIGAITTATLFVRRQALFVRSLGRLEPDGALLRGQHVGAGPFLLGSLRPRIVAPADFETRFSPEARALVLAHERVHLERGDAAINGAMTLVQCLAWFNPLVHFAARLMRLDQELACDAAVVARHPHARRLYAEALLDAALAPLSAPFGCNWPAAGAHSLKERLIMLNLLPVSPHRRRLGLALAGVIALSGAGIVWAANPSYVVGKPDWVDRPTGADLKSLYPKAAEKAGVEGMAVISCRVRSDGDLRACKVRRQDPPRYGFGEAALKMSGRFRMKSRDGDGHPTAGAAVTIPIRFKLAA